MAVVILGGPIPSTQLNLVLRPTRYLRFRRPDAVVPMSGGRAVDGAGAPA